jgi:hypothetical protein
MWQQDQIPYRSKKPAKAHLARCRAPRAVIWSLAIGLLSLASCGPHSDRLQVSGEVTLDGVPLDGGTIRFTSLRGQKLLASGAVVQNGEYRVPAEKGLTPGSYHVEITAPDSNAPPVMVRATPGGPGIPVAPERVPAEYNVDSNKTIEVSAGGDNHFVFDISSRSAKGAAPRR